MAYIVFEPSDGASSPVLDSLLSGLVEGMSAETAPISEAWRTGPDDVPVVSCVYEEADQAHLARLPHLRTGNFILVDHAWFGDDGVRGNHFRIVRGGFQPATLPEDEPDWDRYRSLGLPPVLPWTRQEGNVLVLPHAEGYGELTGCTPAAFTEWVTESLPGGIPDCDIVVRGRRPSGPRPSPEQALGLARVLVGFNTELLLRALRLGVPAVAHPDGSVVAAFNGLGPEDVDSERLFERSVGERERLLASLATFYQASGEEIRTKGFVEAMAERQEWLETPLLPRQDVLQACAWPPMAALGV